MMSDFICIRCYEIVLSVFFFKQKTAYEMRISDWSSDVCSSDLNTVLALARDGTLDKFGVKLIGADAEAIDNAEDRLKFRDSMDRIGLESARDRKSVVVGQSVTVRVDLGGRRSIKKEKHL